MPLNSSFYNPSCTQLMFLKPGSDYFSLIKISSLISPLFTEYIHIFKAFRILPQPIVSNLIFTAISFKQWDSSVACKQAPCFPTSSFAYSCPFFCIIFYSLQIFPLVKCTIFHDLFPNIIFLFKFSSAAHLFTQILFRWPIHPLKCLVLFFPLYLVFITFYFVSAFWDIVLQSQAYCFHMIGA